MTGERERVRVAWVLLADYAEVVNGKLYLMGGGWEFLRAETLPVRRSFALAAAIRVPWNETNEPHRFAFQVQNADGRVLVGVEGNLETGRPAGLPRGVPQHVPLVLNFNLELPEAGSYAVVSRIDGREDARTSFTVIGPRSVGDGEDVVLG